MAVFIYFFLIFLAYLVFNFSKIFKFLKERKKLCDKVGKLDGPFALPLIGTAFQFKIDPVELSLQLYHWGIEYLEKGSHVIKIWIGPQPLIVLLTPDSVKKILESNILIEKSREYDILLPWLGTGLLLSGGSKWKSRRKMLTPSFHFNVLNDFQSVFDEQSRILIKQMENAQKQHGNNQFDVFPYIKRCALDIICETAMGTTVNAQTNHDHPYVIAVGNMNILSFQYQRMPWLWIKPIKYLSGFSYKYSTNLNIVSSFTKDVIERKTEEFRISGKVENGKKKAFLDMLIEMKDEGGLEYEDIREEVDTFMFEGHDTTSAGIGWTLFCLACNPEHQKKCQEELDKIFEEDNDKECTVSDLKQMKYLDKCIKEALRIRPSVPQFARYVEEDVDIGDGLIVPRGSSVMISPAFIHNNPSTYDRHEEYDPERFNEENISKRHAYSYIPFSAGPRNCIGQKFAIQEEKTVISWVLRKYELSTDIKFLENIPLPETIMRPQSGFVMHLKSRFL